MVQAMQVQAIGAAERATMEDAERALCDLMPVMVAVAKAAIGGSRSRGMAAVRRLAEQLARAERDCLDSRQVLALAVGQVEALLDAQPVAGEIPVERASRHDAIEAMRRRGGLTLRQVQAANALMQTWEAAATAGGTPAQSLVAKVDGGGAAEAAQVGSLAWRAALRDVEQAWEAAVTFTQLRLVHLVLADRLSLTVAAARAGVRKQDVGVALRAALTCYADIAGFPASVKGYD